MIDDKLKRDYVLHLIKIFDVDNGFKTTCQAWRDSICQWKMCPQRQDKGKVEDCPLKGRSLEENAS